MSASPAPIDPNERIEVSVTVRPRRPLDELEARLNQPGAAPLSREEYAASYGGDPSDVAKVEAFARQHGLEIVESSPARRTVRLAGKAADIATAWGVQLIQDGEFRGYTGAIQIPSELQGIVEGVFGLDTHPVARRLRRDGQ
jgi:kumamolisin